MADVDKNKEVGLDELTEVEDRVRWFYNHGKGSIQDIARTHRLEVNEVLHILGMDDMTEIQTAGDQIDQVEAGHEVRVNPTGNPARANFTTN